MPAFSVNKKTIGTASRDFATITLWESANPASADTNQIGEVFADSDFDERPSISSTNQGDPSIENPILVAAPGQRPIIKPTTNGNILTLGMNDLQIIGITVDGSSQPGGGGVGFNSVNNAFRHIFVGCEARFCKATGFHFNEPHVYLYCLSHNNDGDGFLNIGSNQGLCLGCGAAKNTLNGFKGLNVNNFLNLRGCWSLDNTGDDVEHIGLTSARFVYISDTSITDQGAPTHTADIFESQSSGSLGFTNFASDDYTLAVGSALRQKGSRFAHRFFGQEITTSPQLALQDVFASNLEADVGDRLDVGPHQPSLVAVSLAIPGAPTLDSVTAGDGQATASGTAANEANTLEVFFWIVGAASATSGGTRTGSGTIPVSGLVNNTQYRFVLLEKNADGCYGPPSTSRTAIPNDGTATDIEAVMFDHLKTQSQITDQVGTRIFPDTAPQKTPLPYITLHFISDPGEHHVGGASKLALPVMQVDVWAKTGPDRKAAANAVRDTLDTLTRVKKGGLFIMNARLTDQRDDYIEPGDGEEIGVFRKSMDFVIHYDRPVPTG